MPDEDERKNRLNNFQIISDITRREIFAFYFVRNTTVTSINATNYENMKKLILITLLSLICLNAVFAQDDEPKLTLSEKRQAQRLATRFYNRLTETQDVKPLIKEFFIKDFSKRVNYCFRTGLCGGHNRDFWSGFAEEFVKTKSKIDFQRFYINWINYFYLFMRIFIYVSPDSGDISKNIPEEVEKENFKKELKILLKNKPGLIRSALQIFQIDTKKGLDEDLFPSEFKSIKKFRQYQNNLIRNISILKPIEVNLRLEKQKRDSSLNFAFLPKDFRIDIDESKLFFNYPAGTRIIEVWSEIWDDDSQTHKDIPLKMDLVKEDGKLKVVAIYPPID